MTALDWDSDVDTGYAEGGSEGSLHGDGAERKVACSALHDKGVVYLNERFDEEAAGGTPVCGVAPKVSKGGVGEIGSVALWINCTSVSYHRIIDI